MNYHTISSLMTKYNIHRKIARHINPNKLDILVKEFAIYDKENKNDPPVIEFESLLRENPHFFSSYWQETGPCSNWGYNVWRKETDEEFDLRVKKQIKELPEILEKRAADLKCAKKKFPIKLDVVVEKTAFGTLFPAEIFNRESEEINK
jgi:hypothetical protein